MTMNEQQIGDALRELTNALNEKLGRQPALGPYLSVDDTSKCSINIYADRIDHYKCTGHATGNTFAEAIDAAWGIVNAIQTCEDEATGDTDKILYKARITELESERHLLREALERIEQLAGAVGVDLQGRVEGGKVSAVLNCQSIASAALRVTEANHE